MFANLQAIPTHFLRPLTIAHAYALDNLRPDLIAGLTVAIISLPQAIAYALVAGLLPQMGLYAAIVIPIVAALWGSSSQVQSSPTTALSLLVLSSLSATLAPNTARFILAAGLLAVLAGLVQLVMGLARLGILVYFVSDAVVVGFAAGAGVQIAAGELRHLFGLSFSSSTLFETLRQLTLHLAQTHLPTLALGLGTLVVMVIVRAVKPKWPAPLINLVAASAVLVALRLDTRRSLSGDELLAGEQVFFAATGITDGPLLTGVRYHGERAETHSLILRANTGSRRVMYAEHVSI